MYGDSLADIYANNVFHCTLVYAITKKPLKLHQRLTQEMSLWFKRQPISVDRRLDGEQKTESGHNILI